MGLSPIKITTIENMLNDHSDELAELPVRVGQLKTKAALTTKTEDLKNCCRWQNLIIFGLTEGLEGGSSVEIISQLLQTVVGSVTFPERPELDRAHRTLAPKPTAV